MLKNFEDHEPEEEHQDLQELLAKFQNLELQEEKGLQIEDLEEDTPIKEESTVPNSSSNNSSMQPIKFE